MMFEELDVPLSEDGAMFNIIFFGRNEQLAWREILCCRANTP
jgi:hypothetical protein